MCATPPCFLRHRHGHRPSKKSVLLQVIWKTHPKMEILSSLFILMSFQTHITYFYWIIHYKSVPSFIGKEQRWHSSNHLLLFSTEVRTLYRFRMTLWWVNDDRIYFWVKQPFKSNLIKCKYSLKRISAFPLISVWAPRSRLHGMINLISSCNYFIVLRKWPHCHQAVDYWQLYKHFLYYMSMSQQLPYTHTNTHIHNAVGILCHLANSQQSLFLRWRLFHVIGPSVVMTLHLFSPSLCKLEKGNLVWHGAQKMY